jgi:hypothetical protein
MGPANLIMPGLVIFLYLAVRQENKSGNNLVK